MTRTLNRPGLGIVAYFTVMFMIGVYFMFASVQGDFGLFRRVQIEAELATLSEERDRLAQEVAVLENKTQRLSDTYLDLDLLDAQARDILGLIRPDEIVLH
jgi:cell division protein FtsB